MINSLSENKDYESFLNSINWDVAKFDLLDGNRDPLEKDFFNLEKYDFEETFTRELIQNSLDAKLTVGKPMVNLKIDELDFSNEPYKSAYKRIVNTELLKMLVDSNDIEGNYKLTYKALKVSDYNTVGLNGEIVNPESNWYKYFSKVGSKAKLSKKDSLGSANLGKVATWKVSNVWSVIVRTLTTDFTIRFQGRALRKTSTIDNIEKKIHSCDVYLRKANKEDVDINESIDKSISSFLKFDKRDDPGTDFIFPEYRGMSREKLISYILKNWFKPIADESINLNIFGLEVNKNTYSGLIDKYSTMNKLLDNEMVQFTLDAQHGKSDCFYNLRKGIPKDKIVGNCRFNSQFFEEENISEKDLARQLYEKKHIQLKVPVKIKLKRGVELENDYFLISIKVRKANKKRAPFGLMFRNYQMLWEEKGFYRAAKGINDLMICVLSNTPNLNTLLTHFEEPSHLTFNRENFTGNDEYEKTNALYNLYLFRQLSNKFLDFILTGDEIENPNALADLFPIPKLKPQDKGSEDADDDEEESEDEDEIGPDEPNPPKDKKIDLVNVSQENGVLRIRSNKISDLVGRTIKFTFGLRGQKGQNPFGDKKGNRLTKYDIDLNKTKFSDQGCRIIISSINFNSFMLEVEEESFCLEISGLANDYGYVTKTELIEENL